MWAKRPITTRMFLSISGQNISECKNWGYVKQVQRVKWYVSYEAGFIFKASRDDLCVMLDKVRCNVVKPWN